GGTSESPEAALLVNTEQNTERHFPGPRPSRAPSASVRLVLQASFSGISSQSVGTRHEGGCPSSRAGPRAQGLAPCQAALGSSDGRITNCARFCDRDRYRL